MAISLVSTLATMDPATALVTLPAVAAGDTIILIRQNAKAGIGPSFSGGGGSGSWQLDLTVAALPGGFGIGAAVLALDVWSCRATANIAAGTLVYCANENFGSSPPRNTSTGGVFTGILSGTRVIPLTGTSTTSGHTSSAGTTTVTVGAGHLTVTPVDDILVLCCGCDCNTDLWPWDDGTAGLQPLSPPARPTVALAGSGGIPSLTSLGTLEDDASDSQLDPGTGFPFPGPSRGAGLAAYCVTNDYSDKTLQGTFSGLIGGTGNFSGSFPDQSYWALGFVVYGGAPSGATGPWNLHTRGGQYHIAYGVSGTINYKRSLTSYPATFDGPYTIAGGGSDSQFRMWEETYPAGRVRGIWTRSGDVVHAVSDDDGATWSSPVTLWSAAKNPTGNHDPKTGTSIFMAFVTDHLEGRVMGPGDSSPTSAFTVAVTSDDATFHVFPAADVPGRWMLIVVDAGAVKNYESMDEGRTWSVI